MGLYVFPIVLILAALWIVRKVPGRLPSEPPQTGREMLAGWAGPAALACGLAAASLPLVAFSLGAFDLSGAPAVIQNGMASASPAQRLAAAAGAVFASALVASTLGAPVVRRNVGIGLLFTFMVALIVAIPAVVVLPAMLGQHVGDGLICIDSCSLAVSTDDPSSSLMAGGLFPFAPFAEPVSVLTLAVGVTIWSWLVHRWQGVPFAPPLKPGPTAPGWPIA